MKRGFTLIELIVVIVIIGILATFAVPQYTGFITRARGAKAKNAISLIVQAEKIIRAETGSYVTFTAAANAVETNLGVNVSGIDLTEIDSDPDFSYSVSGTTITATVTAALVAASACSTGNTITFDMSTNTWAEAACF